MTVGELISKLSELDLSLRVVHISQEGPTLEDCYEIGVDEVYVMSSLNDPAEKV